MTKIPISRKLYDLIIQASGSLTDKMYHGALREFGETLCEAQCFELSSEIAEACNHVMRLRPSSVLSALPLTKLPYPLTWIEWQAPEYRSSTDTNRDRPVPERIGCLLDERGSAYKTMTWVWAHDLRDISSLMINPFSVQYDWQVDLIEENHRSLDWCEDNKHLLSEFYDRTKSIMKRSGITSYSPVETSRNLLNQRAASITKEAMAEYLQTTRRFKQIADNPKEIEAAYLLARRYIPEVINKYCFPLWMNHFVRHRHEPQTIEMLKSFQEDLIEEPMFATAFFTLLNSKSSVTTARDDFSRLNRRRAKRGKPPLKEFVITKLSLSPRKQQRLVSQGVSREAIRQHLVRGHFKVRKSGIYWWSPFIRGAGAQPVTRSHYEVRN